MIEYLTKRKFLNALAREAAEYAERTRFSSSPGSGIYLEFLWPDKNRSALTLIIRGNTCGQIWMVYESGFSADEKGYKLAFKTAVDFAFQASQSAHKKIGLPVSIGIPSVTYAPNMFSS